MNKRKESTSPGIVIAPSILSADFSALGDAVRAVEAAGADWLHIDVMDGHFVPNLTIGPAVVKSLRKHSKLFFDVHLMIERPDRYWEAFRSAGADGITFHAETRLDHRKLIGAMKKAGLKAGVSLRPGSGIARTMSLLPLVDLVLVMTVEPGFGGQAFKPELLPRIAAFRRRIDGGNHFCRLQVDGGINAATAVRAVRAGADTLVAGNSVFGERRPVAALRALRSAVTLIHAT